MQYVNDDMDELFRRAAENYPLDTKGADWNKVLGALQGEAPLKAIAEKKKNKNGRLLWLLLLLPLGLICNQLYSPGAPDGKEVSTTGSDTSVAVDTKTSQKVTNTANTTNSSGIDNSTVVTMDRTDLNKESKDENQVSGSVESSVNSSKIFGSSNLSNSKRDSKNYPANNVTHTNKQIGNQEAGTDALTIGEAGYSRKYVSKISSSPILYSDVVTSVSRELSPLFSPSEENSKPVRAARRKRIYLGILAGIDATTIKFQKIENAGMSYGALVGYQINKKWSIETGLYSEKKYYYSDGKYFNTSKIYMPPNSEIDNVSGNCRMFEVPVVLRRNLSSGKNSQWFATVGGSTYFMKQQNYKYEIYYYNTGTSHNYSKFYKNSSNYFFSNLAISGGYIHRLGNFADLRIEPYLKLPVSGIGIGSLPMFSAGLQIGITKKF
jgi:hypothetical protein